RCFRQVFQQTAEYDDNQQYKGESRRGLQYLSVEVTQNDHRGILAGFCASSARRVEFCTFNHGPPGPRRPTHAFLQGNSCNFPQRLPTPLRSPPAALSPAFSKTAHFPISP